MRLPPTNQHPARRFSFAVVGFAVATAAACDGGASADAVPPDAASADAQTPRPDAAVPGPGDATVAPSPDAAPPDARADAVLPADAMAGPDAAAMATPDAAAPATPDASPDAAPPDAAPASPDAAPAPLAPSTTLDLAAAALAGPAERTADGAVQLDPGGSLTLTVPDAALAGGPRALRLAAEVWRVEDGLLRVNDTPALVPGDADGGFAEVVHPWETDRARPLSIEAGTDRVTLTATSGSLRLFAAVLEDPRAPLPARPAPAPGAAPFVVVAPPPCVSPGCDDTPALAAALEAAPDGPVRFELDATTYTLRTPWVIRRRSTHLAGQPGTILFWAPTVAGEVAAVTFSGGGPTGPEVPLAGAHVAGTRTLALAGALPEGTTTVQLVADDFGDVPEICLGGRDVERFQRHTVHFARVVAQTPDSVTLDRPLFLDLPAEAAPRVQAVDLLAGARVTDLHFLAACPAALLADNVAPDACDVPEVTDDDGLALRHTVGAQAERVAAQAFGKFGVRVENALETRLTANHMDHPSAYGDGGRGYGLHLIRASRTLVREQTVDTCRHAIVVDFGSSDTQILGGHLSRAHLAVVDVHGEASRDTLVRGVTLEGGLTGVLVGGGGTAVHCNDGPRHHVHANHLLGNVAYGVSVSNATRHVFVTNNDVQGSAIPLAVTLGAGDVVARYNRFADSRDAPVFVDATSGPLTLHGNRFDSACGLDAVLVGGGANLPEGAVVQIDNEYCPGDAAP
jgi:hypothetical protein